MLPSTRNRTSEPYDVGPPDRRKPGTSAAQETGGTVVDMNETTTSTTTSWPEQVSFPGQTHTAKGPHDMRPMYLAHHAFRRDLTRFESAVRNTPVGEADVWAALARRWTIFSTVLHHHHTIEDVTIWPAVANRADASGTELLAAMEAEHDLIDPALEGCAKGFAAMTTHPCADHRNALDVHVTTARQLLVDHLRHEETEAIPLIQKLMTADEYAATEEYAGRGISPRQILVLVLWVLEGLSPELRERELAASPVVFRIVNRLFGRRFGRREQATFRYA